MPTGLTKDIVFLFSGVLLSFGLESARGQLVGVVSAGYVSLLCLALFLIVTGGYLIFRHYHKLLCAGAGDGRSHRHTPYDDLRSSLGDGGTPARLYAKWLESALRAVERFFGDSEAAGQSFFQRVIGLSRPSALWTAPAMDRCILFAFIYPQFLLFLGWFMSGRAGPAENVLGLVSEPDPLRRYLAIGAVAASVVGYMKCYRIAGESQTASHGYGSTRWSRFLLWFLVIVAGCLVTDQLLSRGPGTVGGAAIMASSIVGAVAGDVLIAVFSGFVGAAIGTVVMLHFGPFSAGITTAFVCAAIGFAESALGGEGSTWRRLRKRFRFSLVFWWIFLATSIAAYIGLARLLPRSDAWPALGPILLFYGLLPALNAPFLWFSLGLTRALLWLGLERKGWWPYFYALVDAAMAVLVIVLLVAVMVVGIQTLNLMAVKGGGHTILPVAPLLDAVFDSLKRRSFEPEYWWAYTLLLSSMIPSLVNLAIGGFSLVRGIPIMSRHLYGRLPKGHTVAPRDRNWISLVLTIQAVAGICLGFASQFVLLPWWIFGYVLPGMGFGVLKFALGVEAFNLPGRILGNF